MHSSLHDCAGATLQGLSRVPDHLLATAAGASAKILATVAITSGNTTCGLAGIGSSTITVACIGVKCPTCVAGNESYVTTIDDVNRYIAHVHLVAHHFLGLSHDSTGLHQ